MILIIVRCEIHAMPLKSTSNNGKERTIGSDGGEHVTQDGTTISYSGDANSEYLVTRNRRSERLGSGQMPLKGTQVEIRYEVEIPAVDKGQPPTLVKRRIVLERT